jgi:tRNA nucleotidyltransferase (CCA-adding enzyme)
VGLSAGGGDVLDALGRLPGGRELLTIAEARADLAVVGGAARDLLLGREPRELDVVVDGEAARLAAELASSIGEPLGERPVERPAVTIHERFGTAVVEWAAGRIDIAARRAESYPAPGALPQVRQGTTAEDLARRDFTVNAISFPLAGPQRGELQSVPHALEDLAGGRLRILHERSFLEDPTRLLRLARYQARLGFEPEQRTADLAAAALAAGALSTVSGARIGAELRLALSEPDPLATLAALSGLGVLSAIDQRLCLERDLAQAALTILPADGRADLLLLATLLLGLALNTDEDPGPAMLALLNGLEFNAGDRERTVRTALAAPALARKIAAAERPSQLGAAVAGAPLEAVALAGAIGDREALDGARTAAQSWLGRLRRVRLAITGEDLLAAGLPPGPQIGQRLALALAMKLDGELSDGREAELRAATEGL